MNRAITICILLLGSCAPEQSPYPWFENEWISDRDSTLAANEVLQDQTLDDRAAILSKFGELRWKVNGYNLQALYPTEPQFNLQSKFSVDPIDESSFILRIETGTSLTITENQNGFCARPHNTAETTECFVPFES